MHLVHHSREGWWGSALRRVQVGVQVDTQVLRTGIRIGGYTGPVYRGRTDGHTGPTHRGTHRWTHRRVHGPCTQADTQVGTQADGYTDPAYSGTQGRHTGTERVTEQRYERGVSRRGSLRSTHTGGWGLGRGTWDPWTQTPGPTGRGDGTSDVLLEAPRPRWGRNSTHH